MNYGSALAPGWDRKEHKGSSWFGPLSDSPHGFQRSLVPCWDVDQQINRMLGTRLSLAPGWECSWAPSAC